jgi:hypothetical protein
MENCVKEAIKENTWEVLPREREGGSLRKEKEVVG